MRTKRKLALCILITAVSGVVWHPSAANAATYYVATNGNDGNPGSQTQPFRTIKKGLSILRPGDTLYLRAGTYNEGINSDYQTIPAGTSWTNPVTVAAYPGETVTIAGSGINISKPWVQYLVFRGHPGTHSLILDAGGIAGNGFVSIVNAGASSPGNSYIRFQNVEMKNSMNAQGVFIFANRVEVLNSKIHDVRTDLGTIQKGDVHCFYVQGAFTIIDGNEIYNCPSYGLHFYNGYDHISAHNNVIRNNRVHNTSAGPNKSGGGAIIIGSGSNNLVYNNLIYNNPGGGVGVGYGGSGNQVYNNTIFNSGDHGYAINVNRVSNTLVKNNILYQNRHEIVDDTRSTAFAKNHCNSLGLGCDLAGDPKFVNAAAYDFRLQATSPVIDKGVSLSTVVVDFMRSPRPRGAAYDLGAFEFGSNSGPGIPTNVRVR